MLSAIVLAAGSSKRMGTPNKLLLPFKGKTILETTIQNIKDAGLEEVIIVTGYQQVEIEGLIKPLAVTPVFNPDYSKGLTTSIQKAISVATGNGYMLCLADMVLIEADEYALIKNVFDNQVKNDAEAICVPVYNGTRGNPVVFSSYYKRRILNNADMNGCKNIIKENSDHIKQVNMNSDHILTDIDLPEDYNKLKI